MVRTSKAFLMGTIVVCLTAMVAFWGGWKMSYAMYTMSNNDRRIAAATQSTPQDNTPVEEQNSTFKVFWEVWNLVHKEFYHKEPLDEQHMVYGSIRGMLASLGDDYTSFEEPKAAERTRESMRGSFEGIGALLNVQNGQVIIVRPLRKSPAIKAGVQADDVIVKIDGTDVASIMEGVEEGEALEKVVEKIRGKEGTRVRLTLRRPPSDELFDVDIVRAKVPLISVNAHMLEGNIAHIQITEFRDTTPGELDEALDEVLAKNPDGLILDLRNNPGGVLQSALQVLGRFYKGTALYEEGSNGHFKELNTIGDAKNVRVPDIPMVVLVNDRSASAAEIVAGALRDQRENITLLGLKTYGKGSVQNVHKLSDGSSARITIAHWFTPEKHEIHEIGITPDTIVQESQDLAYPVPCIGDTVPPEGEEMCHDNQLVESMQFLQEGEGEQ